jgi:hypothetical protein
VKSLIVCFGAAFVLTLDGLSQAQQAPPPRVARVEFMKIVPGKAAEYSKLERMWKDEIHQDRVGKGQIDSWNLFAVTFPGGTKREYDAVTMHIFSSFDKMEQSYDDAQQAKIQKFPNANALREMVRYEIWTLGLAAGGDPVAGKFADVRFNKAMPGRGQDYVRAARELWMPLNQDMVKKGVRQGWLWFSVMFPGGSNRPYDWVTFDSLERFSDIAGNTFAGADENRLNLAGRISAEARDTVVREYWRLVDRTSPKR